MSSPYPGGFNFGASANPMTMPGTQPTQGTMNPFQILTQLLGGGGQASGGMPDLGAMLSGIRQAKDPQGFADKSYIPGQQGPGNPFDNGFFKTAQERQAVEQQHLGGPGFSSLDPATQQQALMQHPMQNQGNNAAMASPQGFQLNPATANQFGIAQPAPTMQSDLMQPTQNPFGAFPTQVAPPKFAGPAAGSQRPAPRRPMGSPSPSPFSF